MAAADPPLVLGDISTSWRKLHDPLRFVMVYGPAVRAYLRALLKDEHAADEALQDLLLQVTARGFPTADPDRGRFRDYLKAVVRNAARRHLRPGREQASDPADLADADADPADGWRDEWRRCVLDQALRALERHQREAGRGNLGWTAVRLSIDHPTADSVELARRAAEVSGRPLTAEAFRQQLSRARRTFAGLIAAEVRQTLDAPDDAAVRDELAELGLLPFVKEYLPAGG